MSAPWPEVPLTEVADLIRGVSYPKSDSRGDPGPGYVPVLRATNIQDARLVLDGDLVYVAASNVSSDQRLSPGDIVVATSSGSKHLVGKSALLRGAWDGSFGAFCAGIRPKANIDPRYLAYFLQSPRYWKEIGKKALGVNINNLRRGDLETLLLPLPPVAEQRALVDEVEKQFSRLDEAVANLKRVKANLKRYKAAVLKAAVEGRLVPTEAELARLEGRNYDSGAQLLRRIVETRSSTARRGNERYEPSSEGARATPLPDGWAWTTYGQVGRLQLGRQRAPRYHSGPNMRPYLRVQNVFEDRLDFSDVMDMDFPPPDYERYALVPGDLLLNEGQSPELLGRPAIYRGELPGMCFTNTLIRLQAENGVRVEFALLVARHHMHSGRFVDEGSITTNIAHLSVGRLATVEFPLPPTAEQGRIVAEAERQLSIIAAAQRSAILAELQVVKLRAAILKNAYAATAQTQSSEMSSCN